MSRSWNGAYAQNISPENLSQAIKSIYSELTDNKIYPADKIAYNTSDYKYAAQRGLLCCVSPAISGWTAFWTQTARSSYFVFKRFNLSGFLVSMVDNYLAPEENYWEILEWRRGEIVNWIVSKPNYRFGIWHDSTLAVLRPYLHNRFTISLDPDPKNILDFIKRNQMLFHDGLENIFHSLNIYNTVDINEDIFLIEPLTALFKLSDQIIIPYFGPKYHLFDIASFLEFNRCKRLKCTEDLYYLESDIPNRSERPESWKLKVVELSPILFEVDSEEDPIELTFHRYPDLFYFP